MGDPPCFAHLLDEDGRMPDTPGIRTCRVYDVDVAKRETRVLVDGVWPRGVSKESLQLDRWAKELAPSPALRRWFSHDPEKWDAFQARYRRELADKTDLLRELSDLPRPLVLLYSARDEGHNQAVVLKRVLEEANAGA